MYMGIPVMEFRIWDENCETLEFFSVGAAGQENLNSLSITDTSSPIK